MNDNEFFALVWKLITICVCVLVVTIGSCAAHRDRLIAQSDDPVATSCGITSGDRMQQTCEVVRAR